MSCLSIYELFVHMYFQVTWAWEKSIPTPENAEEKPIWSYDCIGFVRSIIAEVSVDNDAIETTKQMVGDMQLHGKAMAWYGAKNPTSQDGKQEFLDWIRNQPYLLNNNDDDGNLIAGAKNQSNFRRIRPKKFFENVTLKSGDIIATPNHTMIFVEWIKFSDDKWGKTITKEGNNICLNLDFIILFGFKIIDNKIDNLFTYPS